ncbi:endoglucanase, partial [Streptomyces sp. SID6648]|nr:endoglucanase [Streptomyces sp. SID6648]
APPAPPSPSASPTAARTHPGASPRTASADPSAAEPRPTAAATGLYRHPDSQVLDWVRTHPDDPRRDVIAARIAGRPAAVWFADP